MSQKVLRAAVGAVGADAAVVGVVVVDAYDGLVLGIENGLVLGVDDGILDGDADSAVDNAILGVKDTI